MYKSFIDIMWNIESIFIANFKKELIFIYYVFDQLNRKQKPVLRKYYCGVFFLRHLYQLFKPICVCEDLYEIAVKVTERGKQAFPLNLMPNH